jgi:hypothetical protein
MLRILSQISWARVGLAFASLTWAFVTGMAATLPVHAYDAYTDAFGMSPLLEMTLLGIAIACAHLALNLNHREDSEE